MTGRAERYPKLVGPELYDHREDRLILRYRGRELQEAVMVGYSPCFSPQTNTHNHTLHAAPCWVTWSGWSLSGIFGYSLYTLLTHFPIRELAAVAVESHL